MAIILKKVMMNDNKDLVINSNTIIGVIGNNYQRFLEAFNGKEIYYMKDNTSFKKKIVFDELLLINKNISQKVLLSMLDDLGLNDSFLEEKTDCLSSSQKRLLQYLIMFISNPRIMIINEPFLDLDLFYKRKIMLLLKKIIRNTKKTVIIGSNNSDIIYSLCKKVLLIKKNSCIYGDTIKIMTNKKILINYDINEPDIVKFINLAREKGKNIPYTIDIRDLMKDVFKNV